MSRSPRPNQVGSTPYAASSSLAFQVSSRATPAALGVDAVAEGVHHRVQVGADLEAVHPEVVGGVRHDGHRRCRPARAARSIEAQDALQEPRAADAAGAATVIAGGGARRRPEGGHAGRLAGESDMDASVDQCRSNTRFRLTTGVRQACNHTSVISQLGPSGSKGRKGRTPCANCICSRVRRKTLDGRSADCALRPTRRRSSRRRVAPPGRPRRSA